MALMEHDLLSQLIHPTAPPPVAWWPPAIGWWVVASLLLLFLLLMPWLVHYLRRHKLRRRRNARQILADIPAHLPDSQWLAAVNVRLKRLIRQRGDEAATRLYGAKWVDYLCQRYPKAQREALEPLADDLYRPDVVMSLEQRRALLKELRRWMRYNDV